MPATQPAAASAVALAAATDEAASGAHRALQEEAAPGAADALLQALQEHQAEHTEALVPTPAISAAASAARPQGAGWLAWAIVAGLFFQMILLGGNVERSLTIGPGDHLDRLLGERVADVTG